MQFSTCILAVLLVLSTFCFITAVNEPVVNSSYPVVEKSFPKEPHDRKTETNSSYPVMEKSIPKEPHDLKTETNSSDPVLEKSIPKEPHDRKTETISSDPVLEKSNPKEPHDLTAETNCSHPVMVKSILKIPHDLTNCINVTLKPREFCLLPDGSLRIEIFDTKLETSFFIFWNDSVTVCKPSYVVVPEFPEFSDFLLENSRAQITDWTLKIIEILISLSAFSISWFSVMMLDDETSFINGTYGIFFACLLFLSIHFGIMFYFGEPFCGNILMRIPAMVHFFIVAFLFWYSAFVLDLMQGYQSGKVVNRESEKKTIRRRITVRQVLGNNFLRMVMIVTISAFMDIWALIISVKKSGPKEQHCVMPGNVMFTYLLRPVLAYYIVGFLNFMYSQHLQMLVSPQNVKKVFTLRNLYGTHFGVFIMMIFTWLIYSLFIFTSSDDLNLIICSLEISQLCVLLMGLPLKQQWESGSMRSAFKRKSIKYRDTPLILPLTVEKCNSSNGISKEINPQ